MSDIQDESGSHSIKGINFSQTQFIIIYYYNKLLCLTEVYTLYELTLILLMWRIW